MFNQIVKDVAVMVVSTVLASLALNYITKRLNKE